MSIEIKPQEGPQKKFLESNADIAIYGGAAGGGKSYALMLEPLRHIVHGGFRATIFRRTLADVKKQGSLWDSSMGIYGSIGAVPNMASLTWKWPSGASVAFAGLDTATDVVKWQGSQLGLLAFDELTQFSRYQFFYMLSRNRSPIGMRPYVRATTNPDAGTWVAEFIAWWIDQETGLPMPERAGKLRYFARIDEELKWASSREELKAQYPGCEPKSVTFIPATLEDNRILMAADPGYRAWLLALPMVERERLLGGNWKVRQSAGSYFKREWCATLDAIPAGTSFVRGWDLAGTAKTESNDPDWTAGTKIGRMPSGRFVVCDHRRMRGTPMEVERLVLNTASSDGKTVRIAMPQDPGQAGKGQAQYMARMLAGYDLRIRSVSSPIRHDADHPDRNPKVTRFRPFSSQAEVGNIDVLRGAWNEQWFSELEAFPEGRHDDDVDSTSEAFNMLTEGVPQRWASPIELSAPRGLPM